MTIDVIYNGAYNDVYIFLLLSDESEVVDNCEHFVRKTDLMPVP